MATLFCRIDCSNEVHIAVDIIIKYEIEQSSFHFNGEKVLTPTIVNAPSSSLDQLKITLACNGKYLKDICILDAAGLEMVCNTSL